MESRSATQHGPRRMTHDVGAAARAFALPVEALRLLAREKALRRMALIPLALSAIALAAAVGVIAAVAGDLDAAVSALVPRLEVGAWYTWLWVGPARVVLWVGAKLLFLVSALLIVVAAFLVASLVASPFHDVLARRVEQIETGGVAEEAGSGVRAILAEGGRAVREELRRLAFFVAVWLVLVAFGVLVPGGQLVAPAALTLFTLLFLPLDYASYTFDRRRLTFPEKRRWVRANLGASLGFGAAAFALCAVPGVNLLAMPVLVVAGTLLALRHPPREPAAQRPS